MEIISSPLAVLNEVESVIIIFNATRLYGQHERYASELTVLLFCVSSDKLSVNLYYSVPI